MNELDWEYIIDVLDKATAGATGCSPTLFDASNALQKLQNEFDQPLDEVERQKCIGALENFHTHSGILHDLGFLEVWAPRDFFARWGGRWVHRRQCVLAEAGHSIRLHFSGEPK